MEKNVLNTQESEADLSASDSETFSDTKKGSEEVKIDYCTIEESIVSVKIDELEVHPLNQSIYIDADSNKVKSLAQNIKDHSLINRIIVNKKLQILSGNLRFQALKLLNVSQTEAYVIDIKQEDELEFIISSNQQREKTVIDARNEINSLFDKYSPGQGNRDSQGENTIKKITLLTGYSTNKISTIRKIDATFPALLGEVYKGNLTLNSALKQCDVVEHLKVLSEVLGNDLLEDLPVDKIDDVFDKSVLSYCNNSKSEYYAMIIENQMSTSQAYDKLFSSKKPKESNTIPYNLITGRVDDSMYCPCCSQKVKKTNKELEWIKKWNQAIIEFIVKLKLPDNE